VVPKTHAREEETKEKEVIPMVKTNDWITNAAIEIDEQGSSDESAGWVREVIAKHCPFKPDTTYMPIPRCDTCVHWTRYPFRSVRHPTHESGTCGNEALRILSDDEWNTLPDFGCVQWKAKEDS